MSISNHCQHCGEEMPYHGPWKKPEDLTGTDHGLQIIFIHKSGGKYIGTVVITWDSNNILINSQIECNMPITEITKWMPAPE